MTPEEVYKLPVNSERADINLIARHLTPEIPMFDCGIYIPEEDQREGKVKVHYFLHHYFDHRRYWEMAGVSYDGTFCMITQNAGREGDDYSARFITNRTVFDKMVAYIESLVKQQEPDYTANDVVEMNEDINELGNFYGYTVETIPSW